MMRNFITIVFLSLFISANESFGYQTIEPNSAQQLRIMAFYGDVSPNDVNYISQFTNLYCQPRVDIDPPSLYLEYERNYDLAVRKYGMQMELQFQTFFENHEPNEWDAGLKFLSDRFAAGDRLEGLVQVAGPDEPYHFGWSKEDLSYALGLLKKHFPNARTRVNFVRNDALQHGPPDNLDIVSSSYYPFVKNSTDPNEAIFKGDKETYLSLLSRIVPLRDAGFTQPIQYIAQSYEAGSTENKRMPDANEMRWYYEVLNDPNNAWLNVEGLMWYGWDWSGASDFNGVGHTTDGIYLGDGGTPMFSDQLNQVKEIGKAIGRLPAIRSKPHFVGFDGSCVPYTADPNWSFTGRMFEQFGLLNGWLPDANLWAIDKVYGSGTETLIAEGSEISAGQYRLKIGGENLTSTYSYVTVDSLNSYYTTGDTNELTIDVKFKYPDINARNYCNIYISPEPINISNRTAIAYEITAFADTGDHYFRQYVNGTLKSDYHAWDYPAGNPFGKLLPNTEYWVRFHILYDSSLGYAKVKLYLSVDGTNWTYIKDAALQSELISDEYYIALNWSGKTNAGETTSYWLIDTVEVTPVELLQNSSDGRIYTMESANNDIRSYWAVDATNDVFDPYKAASTYQIRSKWEGNPGDKTVGAVIISAGGNQKAFIMQFGDDYRGNYLYFHNNSDQGYKVEIPMVDMQLKELFTGTNGIAIDANYWDVTKTYGVGTETLFAKYIQTDRF